MNKCSFGFHNWTAWEEDPVYERVTYKPLHGLKIIRRLLNRHCLRCGKSENTRGAVKNVERW